MALTVIYLDIVLYSIGGVIGTMHHLYFSGTPAEHMALGAFFSAAEVIPLTFLTVEAWSFLQLGARQESRSRTSRYMIPEARWSERAAKISFWSLNAGFAWMVFATLFPLGLLQLYEAVNHGYFEARSMKYIGLAKCAKTHRIRHARINVAELFRLADQIGLFLNGTCI